jgi:hypothetical protein
MLSGLGEEYVPMTVVSSDTKISNDYVRSMLRQQESKHHTKKDDPQDKALIANWKGKKLFIVIFSVCNKKGCKSYQCKNKEEKKSRKKKKGEKEGKTKQKAEKATVSLVALSNIAMDSEWVIYCRAGLHISGERTGLKI